MQRKQIAQETLLILKQGKYQSPLGRSIDLTADLRYCTDKTQYYEPDALEGIRGRVLSQPAQYDMSIFEVKNETSLQGSARLALSYVDSIIGVLNFASAKNPGGGFLNGAQAQEESLARSSGLYSSLLKCHAFYEFHREQHDLLYSDRMIYSPRCPVFRNDEGALLEQPYYVEFITSPAPNAGVLQQQNDIEKIAQLEIVLRERASKFLGLAHKNGCNIVVLGAWGCGVFRNDPKLVARIFHDLLGPGKLYWQRFHRVVFSVLDSSRNQETYKAFLERFLS
jgi:uncharacterized protein (TIGR02452 family)